MKVGVIMGGISSEREISLKSGKSIIENIKNIPNDTKIIFKAKKLLLK